MPQIIEKGFNSKLISCENLILDVMRAARSLPLIATVIIFLAIGMLISSIQYDISYFAEQVSAITAISAVVYTINSVRGGHSVHMVVVGGCFMVATWAYFFPVFSDWAISIMNDLAIIVFFVIGVLFNGKETR